MNKWNDDKVFAGWDTPLEVLRYAVVQSNYEGRTVPKSLADRVAALDDDVRASRRVGGIGIAGGRRAFRCARHHDRRRQLCSVESRNGTT